MPVAVTLVSEYIPARVRGRFIVLLESFWGLGWLVAALVSRFVIPDFGWQAAFMIGGIPALYAIVIWKLVPESVPYLINRGRVDEAQALVKKIERKCGVEVMEILKLNLWLPSRISRLPSSEWYFAHRTLMLWLIWFGIVFSYYGILPGYQAFWSRKAIPSCSLLNTS